MLTLRLCRRNDRKMEKNETYLSLILKNAHLILTPIITFVLGSATLDLIQDPAMKSFVKQLLLLLFFGLINMIYMFFTFELHEKRNRWRNVHTYIGAVLSIILMLLFTNTLINNIHILHW